MAMGTGGPPSWGDYPPLGQDRIGTVHGDHPGRTMPAYMDREGFYGELRFLRIQGVDDKSLPDEPFVIRKSIQTFIGGKIEGAFKENGGKSYALKVRQVRFYNRLLEMRSLSDNTPVEVIPHPSMNSTRCVVSCRDVINATEEKVLEELEDQGVTEVRRITRKSGDTRINTPTLIIAVRGTGRPEFLDFGYIRCRTRPYYPAPMQCFACWAFGHTRTRCKSSPVCKTCAKEHTVVENVPCSAEKFCSKCQTNEHGIGERSCPEYKKENEIQKIRVDFNLPYAAARRQYEASRGTASFANVASNVNAANSAATSHQEEMAQLNRKIDTLLEIVEKRDKRIEYLENALAAQSNSSASLALRVPAEKEETVPLFMRTFLDRQEEMIKKMMETVHRNNIRMQEDIATLQSKVGLTPNLSILSMSSPNNNVNHTAESVQITEVPLHSSIQPTTVAFSSSLAVESPQKEHQPITALPQGPATPLTKTSALTEPSLDASDSDTIDISSDSSPNTTPTKQDTPVPNPKTPNRTGTKPKHNKVPLSLLPSASSVKRPINDVSPDKPQKDNPNAAKQQRKRASVPPRNSPNNTR